MPVYLGFDRLLPDRIRKYVESNEFVDLTSMADTLQNQYRKSYGNRKKVPFRKLVSKVYQGMVDDGELQDPIEKYRKRKQHENNDRQSDSEEDTVYVEYEDTNMMNRSVIQMYNNEDKEKKLAPSRNPQPFQTPSNRKQSTPQQGWFIDRGKKGDGKLKPTALVDRQPSTPKSVASNVEMTPVRPDNASMVDIRPLLDKRLIEDIPEAKPTVAFDSRHKQNKPNFKRKSNSNVQSKIGKKKIKKRKGEDDDVDKQIEDVLLPGSKKFTLIEADVTFANVAGNDKSLQELARLLLHMSHPEIYQALGVSPPRGVLLHGPPGCGKSLLGCAIAGQLNLPLLKLVGPELVTGVSGESERRVRDVFETAVDNAPCVLFLDEIDAVAQKRENSSKDMERRIVAQLLSCLDDLNKGSHQVMVVGATNQPAMLDPALRRAGRFDREICLGIPDEKARRQILSVLCKNLKLSDDINFDLIARLTPGYVGADLMSLCREAAMRAVTRIFSITDGKTEIGAANILEWLKDPTPFADDKLASLSIETRDFQLAVPDVQPSAKREGFATVPDVTWDNVGALETVREELSIAILGPVRNPAAFAALGLTRASGVLLAGPPGCGKTLLAKAIANESGINFVSVKGPELLNMYVGESERAVRQCFERARDSAPCVIFFDELDSLCPRRSSVETSASARVVNQMLTELDGLESRKQVFVMAATNRPDIIDPAVLRPGRLDKTLYIGIPSSIDRVKILQTITKNGTRPQLSDDVSLEKLAMDTRCDGFTGADLSALVREASLNAIRMNIKHEWNEIMPDENKEQEIIAVTNDNFNNAFSKVCPSISKTDRVMYEDMRKNLERT